MEYKVNVFNNDGKQAKATEFFKSMKRYETTNQKSTTIFNFLDLIKNKSKEVEESKERAPMMHHSLSEKEIADKLKDKNNNMSNKIHEIEKKLTLSTMDKIPEIVEGNEERQGKLNKISNFKTDEVSNISIILFILSYPIDINEKDYSKIANNL